MTQTLLIALIAFALSTLLVYMVRRWSSDTRLLDVPNARSSHHVPTPRVGGIGIVIATVAALTLAGATRTDPAVVIVMAGAVAIAVVSLIDDLRFVPSVVRLAVHVGVSLLVIDTLGYWPQLELPGVGTMALAWLAVALTLAWLVGSLNAYNFMDGIDGIAGGQAVVAGLAWAALGWIDNEPVIITLGVVLAASSLGFLLHNWSPARVFMGDVGSTFLGYSFAVLPLLVPPKAFRYLVFAVLVMWPFVFDATFTFFRRLITGEDVLVPHRSHLYQRLVVAGRSHAAVAWLYIALAALGAVVGIAGHIGDITVRGGGGALVGAAAIALWRYVAHVERDTATADVKASAPLEDATVANRRWMERATLRNRYILAADLMLVLVCAFLAFVLRLDWFFGRFQEPFNKYAAAAVVVKPLVFFAFGLYQRYWRYASVRDLVAVVFGASASSFVMAALVGAALVTGYISAFPRSVLMIDWLLTLVALAGVRLSVRIIGETVGREGEHPGADAPKPVLVVGAGEAGAMIVREAQRNPHVGVRPVGFIDDDPAKFGKRIHGVPVLGGREVLFEVVSAYGIREVIIALPKAHGTLVRFVTEACRKAGVPSRTIPGMFELLDGKATVSRLRRVEIGDLLRRTQHGSSARVPTYLHARTVLITGAGGSIGSEMCRQVAAARPARLVLFGHGENSIFQIERHVRELFPSVPLVSAIGDIRDADRLGHVFEASRPHVVIHAAAHKHVPLMESNPEEAITNNVLGTRNVVDAALRFGTHRLVMISSDKAVSPTSVMGASKRLAELIVRQSGRQHDRAFVVVRFGNVLGSRGSVIPEFKRQIEQGGPIQITHPDMRRFFMTIHEAVHLVLQAGGMGRSGELFVLNMGEAVRIVDLATDLVRLSGLDPQDIPIEYIGLRRGEKIEEQLWERSASVRATDNPEVWSVIEENTIGADALPEVLAELIDAARRGDPLQIQALLAMAIPTFVPSSAASPVH